jgi:nicotinic acid mononucleotide adenylyltransferase
MDKDKDKVVFTFQGAFGPPTHGHYKSMEAFINRIITDYNTNVSEYIFMFMPTKTSKSKPHLEPTTDHRKEILNLFCEKLRETIYPSHPDKKITIISSDIEIKSTQSSATINTIAAIKATYKPEPKEDENLKIIIGMGQDNAYQLPYWERIKKYANDVDKIYLVKREPESDTEVTTRPFKSNDGITELGTFDAKVPSWANKPDNLHNLEKVFNTIAYKKGSKDVLAENVTIQIAIPDIIEIDTRIPPSSSSLIRYFIKQYSIIEELEEELEKLEEIRTNIKKLIFGKDTVDKEEEEKEKEEELVNTVIDDYKTHGLLQYIPDEHEKYNKEYLNYEDYLTSMTEGGGKKKRSSKKRTMKKKRKSKKGNYSKKNRRKSTRKRGGNSNDINNYHNINKKT